MKKITIIFGLMSFVSNAQDSVSVLVNLEAKHQVGEIDHFDREKFITVHSTQMERDWDGDNKISDLRDHFLKGYDVYLGRATGGITGNLKNMKEDSGRPGYADPTEIAQKGARTRKNYASKQHLHTYESRKQNFIVGAQLHPFWTGESQKPTKKGWKLASPTAVGEYMGRYLNAFFGGEGEPAPAWVEIINEPAYEALGGKKNFTNSLKEIAEYHVQVADAIRQQAPHVKLGGYTVAFPDFETGDFQRWLNRDKLFIDIAGEKMDFWSWHLYDFPAIGNRVDLRSGSNVEATFDMQDQYSLLRLGETKPYVISEYGAQTHNYNGKGWNAYRDWLFLRAQNSLLMSFLERPDAIAVALPFTVIKGEWGFNKKKNDPYPARLMRKENEPESYTGQWIYTHRVKFYELWEHVEGTRVFSQSSDLDIQVDAYMDAKKGYVIVNNLEFEPQQIDLELLGGKAKKIKEVRVKQLTLETDGKTPVLKEELHDGNLSNFRIDSGATLILEYTFTKKIKPHKKVEEHKYFSDRYLQPIIANKTVDFKIHQVVKSGEYGAAVLRVSLGRDHGKNLHPKVLFNGKEVKVPTDWRGYDQKTKGRFFGTLEIPVPYNWIKENNKVSISLPDDGGHVSTVVLQVFDFSHPLKEL
ncbi:hypothetical protein [Ochrovirga pacifica]|uniref:hypothetical protein n=1 Tax=Ochrovirga pacifica TaxID=1042376 RepID=UPI0002E194DF|nr:hypothetical protein [Ochrovirga pacifica]